MRRTKGEMSPTPASAQATVWCRPKSSVGHLRGGDDERGVGGGVERRELAHRMDVARVGHHDRHGLELFEK
jgi:hypothetical protein